MYYEIELIAVLCFFVLSTIVFYLRYIKTAKSESSLNADLASLKAELAKREEELYRLNDYEEIKNERLNLLKDKEFLSEELEKSSKELTKTKEDLKSIEDNKNNLFAEFSRIKEELKNTNDKLANLDENFNKSQAELKSLDSENTDLRSENSALKQKVDIFDESLKNLEIKYENMIKTLEENLKEQNEKNSKLIHEENTKVLIQNSKEVMKEIFEPIKEKVNEYKDNILKQGASIETNIKNMFETSQNLGKKADEFARILKGDKKARGDFGEVMLKSCLLASGLVEGENFTLQQSFKDEENRQKRPDAIVYFEPNKCVVIDAKFSLPNDIDSPDYKKQIADNISARINELCKKDYDRVVKYANDYVILFVPYQNIIDLALEAEPNLLKQADSKKVFIVSPTTLYMGLKMIYFGWKNYEINENIHKIFDEFGKFYDKFALFYDDYEKLKNQTNNSFKKINTHLYGKGNIKNRLESLKNLGAKTSKILPELEEEELLLLENNKESNTF